MDFFGDIKIFEPSELGIMHHWQECSHSDSRSSDVSIEQMDRMKSVSQSSPDISESVIYSFLKASTGLLVEKRYAL